MKALLITLAITSSLLLGAPALRAQQKNAPPPNPSHKPGSQEVHLLPPAMVERLGFTDEQKQKLKTIEESFAQTQQAYYAEHKAEIDAAREAMERAMSGLKEQRQAAMEQVKGLLTDEQKAQMKGSKGKPQEQHDAPKTKPAN